MHRTISYNNCKIRYCIPVSIISVEDLFPHDLQSRRCVGSLPDVLRVLNSLYNILFTTIQYNTIQYNAMQYNTIQYNTIQYNTIQYNTIQYNTIQYNAIQYNTIPGNLFLL